MHKANPCHNREAVNKDLCERISWMTKLPSEGIDEQYNDD